MKTLTRITALLLLSSLVFAFGEKQFTMQPPIAYEDGSPLPPQDILEYRLYCDDETVTPVYVQPNFPNTRTTIDAPANTFMSGTHTCFATAVDNDGTESGPSNAVNFTVPLPRPNPPILVE